MGSIEDNIRLGDKKGDRNRVEDVVKMLKSKPFIQKLTNGYHTLIGDGSERLSAGEKQLLVLARALYKGPKILVFDEATSNVDPETERLIQEGIKKLTRGRTPIIIAHRHLSVKDVDRIILLHRGKVHEIGTYSELMAKKGIFYRLYEKTILIDRELLR